MSGWNTLSCVQVLASNCNRKSFEVELKDITPIDLDSVPLQLMSWDIEVSTETGKFDSNGYNPNNKVVCICYTVGSPMKMCKSVKQVCIIATDHFSDEIQGE